MVFNFIIKNTTTVQKFVDGYLIKKYSKKSYCETKVLSLKYIKM